MSTQERAEPKHHRICYLAPDVALPAPRGSSVHVAELARSLADLGNEVHVISRRLKNTDPKTERMNGFTVHRVYRWILKPEGRSSFTSNSGNLPESGIVRSIYYLYLLTIFRLYISFLSCRIISKHRLNLIIERETAFGAGAIASILTGMPLILEIIGPRYSWTSVRRSKVVFYYTESMLREWVDRAKCIPVPAGVNLGFFREDFAEGQKSRSKLGLKPTDFVVGYVGTFQDWHGIDELIDAIGALGKENRDLKALLVGPNFEKYAARVQVEGLSDFFRFTGPVDYSEVPRLINSCDAMVALYNPSANPLRKKYGIGWPIKILEYMACGKPVISTNVDPIDKIVTGNSLGILVQPGSPAEVAKALEELMSNPVERKRIGENGRELVNAEYSWNSVASMMFAHF